MVFAVFFRMSPPISYQTAPYIPIAEAKGFTARSLFAAGAAGTRLIYA